MAVKRNRWALTALLSSALSVGSCAVPTGPRTPVETPEPTPAEPVRTERSQPWPSDPSRPGPGVARVAASPKHFKADSGEPLDISFELDRAGEAEIEIRDEAGYVVRRLELGTQPPGRVQAAWDGRDDAGQTVPSGIYLYLIQVRGSEGAVSVYGEGPLDAGDEIIPQQFSVDRETGQMAYLLPRAGRVSLRVGLRNYPHLRTLLDWEPQQAGRQEIAWDGLDESGHIGLLGHPALRISMFAFELPRNSLIVERHGVTPARGIRGASPYPSGFRHALHPPARCHEPLFDVDFPGVVEADAAGRPILGPEQVVRVTLAPDDLAHLVNTRFEVMFFVDTTFLFEEEEGSSPFSYRLDAGRLSPGPHLLTVNVLSYDDHVGVVTLPFVAPGNREGS